MTLFHSELRKLHPEKAHLFKRYFTHKSKQALGTDLMFDEWEEGEMLDHILVTL